MKVSILGMGAFGIALTKILKKDVEVSMWTNFEDELKQKIGGWLYTEFNNRGLTIPALKLYKGDFVR